MNIPDKHVILGRRFKEMNHEKMGVDLRGSSLDAIPLGEGSDYPLPKFFALEKKPMYTKAAEGKTNTNGVFASLTSATENGTVIQPLYKQYIVLKGNNSLDGNIKEILHCFIHPLTSCFDNGKNMPLQMEVQICEKKYA
jgi:hypothetical protein